MEARSVATMKITSRLITADVIFKVLIVVGLVTFAILTRLLPHPPNFTSVAAVAIFAGALLPKKWAIVVPSVTMLLSDAIIGFHSLILVTWGSMMLSALMSGWLMRKISVGKVITTGIMSSVIFFVVTNFAVWAERLMYPPTWAGLIQCYYNALPFFRNSLAGDVAYSLALFGCYVLVRRYVVTPRSAGAVVAAIK